MFYIYLSIVLLILTLPYGRMYDSWLDYKEQQAIKREEKERLKAIAERNARCWMPSITDNEHPYEPPPFAEEL